MFCFWQKQEQFIRNKEAKTSVTSRNSNMSTFNSLSSHLLPSPTPSFCTVTVHKFTCALRVSVMYPNHPPHAVSLHFSSPPVAPGTQLSHPDAFTDTSLSTHVSTDKGIECVESIRGEGMDWECYELCDHSSNGNLKRFLLAQSEVNNETFRPYWRERSVCYQDCLKPNLQQISII